jgi:hypothetical protein
MLKFNYSNIHGKYLNELFDDSANSFAQVFWKGNLTEFITPGQALDDFPSLIYLELTNEALVVYKDSAYKLSLTQIE